MMIPELLKAWRHHHHMSVVEAAERIGVSWEVYYRAEKGRAMRPDTFIKVMTWIVNGSPL
jgi:DNA-binding XRE family transcriptional regulator